jgi:hypothetical protein
MSHACTFCLEDKELSFTVDKRFTLFDNYHNYSAANRHQRFQSFMELLCDLTGCFFEQIIVYFNSAEKLKTNAKCAEKKLHATCCVKGKVCIKTK